MMTETFLYELEKNAGLLSSIVSGTAKLIRHSPLDAGIGRGMRYAANPSIKGFGGIFARKAPEFAREVDPLRYGVHATSEGMFSPKGIVGRTGAAIQDLITPWRGNAPLGTKVKNALTDLWHGTKYKPGNTWVDPTTGKTMQNVHRRTGLGMVAHTALNSGAGAGALSFAFNSEDPMGKRLGKAALSGLTWSKIGLPIAAPVTTVGFAADIYKGIRQKQKANGVISPMDNAIN